MKTVIVIAGPTAVGKTSVAIQVARHFGTEIISADSRQCFRELNIGVARPSEEELALAKHYFIASHSIHDKITAATFEQYALLCLEMIFQRQDIAVVTGGTGLYIKALTEGMDIIPEVPDDIRKEIVEDYEKKGFSWLQEEVKNIDPLFAEKGEMQNPQRMMRALEIIKTTGQSILSFRSGMKRERAFKVIKLALELPREQLHRNIHTRVDLMMEYGLKNEVQSLIGCQELNALKTVGYQELFDHFSGKISLKDAVDAIKTHTRQYAKRQVTWFRKDQDYAWLPADAEKVIRNIEQSLSRDNGRTRNVE
ncbi:MAG: tRNA (adenosine(37)-N6)-dimethylallyltransferase MiaA [Flavisolibacter sp.]